VCEGLELLDAGTLRDFYVQPLSTVRLVVLPGGGASSGAPAPATTTAAVAATGAPAPAPAPAQAEAAESGDVIGEDEMARAIVVTGLPEADAADTERSIAEAFGSFGPLTRCIFQSTGAHGAGAGAQSWQHAVIVFARESSAAAALAADSTLVMGAPVHVVLASTLAPPPPPPVAGPDGTFPPMPRRPALASFVIADMIAEGYVYGVQGVAHLKRFDTAHGVSQRISVVADSALAKASELDRRYRVRETVATTYEMAKVQALELDRQYGIREKVDSAARAATALAATAAHRAMANPTVAATVTTAKETFTSLFSQAKEEAAIIGARVHEKVQRHQNAPGGPQ
jgi:hypothetical protein